VKVHSFSWLMIAATLAGASASCGEYVRNQGRSPSQIVIQTLQGARGNTPTEFGTPLVSDVETLVTTPDPCTQAAPCRTVFGDLGQVTMSLILKDPGAAGVSATPSSLNAVTFNRYRVDYRRTDGHNIVGVDVPFPIDSALTFTVPSDATATAGFELVRISAKREAPLRELLGGGRQLSMIADVTFYGRDQAGNDVTAGGSIGVQFGDFLP
jgi:hypothetical protein